MLFIDMLCVGGWLVGWLVGCKGNKCTISALNVYIYEMYSGTITHMHLSFFVDATTTYTLFFIAIPCSYKVNLSAHAQFKPRGKYVYK